MENVTDWRGAKESGSRQRLGAFSPFRVAPHPRIVGTLQAKTARLGAGMRTEDNGEPQPLPC